MEMPNVEMKPKQRFLVALKNKQPDKVPIFDFLFSRPLYEHVIGRRPETYNAFDVVECTLTLGLDAAYVIPGGNEGLQPRLIDQDTYIEEWGVTMRKDPHAWPLDAPVDYPMKSKEDWKNYTPPDPRAKGRLKELEIAIKKAEGRIAIIAGVGSIFTRAWLLTGMEYFSLALYDDPDFIQALLNMCTNYGIQLGKRLITAGVDAILIPDDFGHKTGSFMSPFQFRNFIFSYLQKEVHAFKKLGIPVLLHTCGNVNSILDQLVESGVDGYNPVQRTAGMDLKRVKDKYGKRISLCGNVDATITLPYGTEEEVEEEVKECLRVGASGEGYILASDHSFHEGIPVRNILKMIETAKRYGEYPLRI